MKTSMHKLVTLCIAAAICAVATSAMAAVNNLESYLFRFDFSKGANEFSSSPSYADSTSSARIRRRQTGRTGCRAPRQRQARRAMARSSRTKSASTETGAGSGWTLRGLTRVPRSSRTSRNPQAEGAFRPKASSPSQGATIRFGRNCVSSSVRARRLPRRRRSRTRRDSCPAPVAVLNTRRCSSPAHNLDGEMQKRA